jgi:hypothetical protein
MHWRFISARHSFCLDRDVMDRKLRFQHNCNGAPHRFCILHAANRNMRG